MDRGGAHSEGSGVIKAQLKTSQAELVYACRVRYNSILDAVPELHVSSGLLTFIGLCSGMRARGI